MGSITVCLVPLLMLLLMGAIGKAQHDRPAGPPPYYWDPRPPLPPHFRRPARKPHFDGSARPPHLYRTGGIESRGTRVEDERRAFRKFPRWRSCGINPWEMSGKFEGDMKVMNSTEVKLAIRDKERIWPNREIPYDIDDFYFHEEEIKEIRNAIKEFNTFTCVSMRPATEDDKDYILITGKREGCCTNIGRIGGVQELNLEPPACVFKRGCVHHEFMHAAGFAHEHNSPARDKYIRIRWENIGKDKIDYFAKMDYHDVTDYGFDYDLGSIMHPSRKAYSMNNFSTIETVDEFAVIGQARILSEYDIQKVNIHYGCIEHPFETTEYASSEELGHFD